MLFSSEIPVTTALYLAAAGGSANDASSLGKLVPHSEKNMQTTQLLCTNVSRKNRTSSTSLNPPLRDLVRAGSFPVDVKCSYHKQQSPWVLRASPLLFSEAVQC